MSGLWSLPAGYKSKKSRTSSTPRKQPERSLQTRIATMLSWMLPPEVPWTSIAHGVYVSGDPKQAARMGARLKAAGLHAGWPDLMLIFKSRPIFIEIKAGTYLSQPQKLVHTQIVAAGGIVRVCRSEDDVVELLEALGVPLRARLSPAERASAIRL